MAKMWIKALQVIPRISKDEWDRLDIFSKWLISSRAAVFIMTATAGIIGGLLAYRDGQFSWPVFVLAVVGIVLAHATNNLLNDYTDYVKGIDHNNYFRAQYGPHPLEHGFVTKSTFHGYILVTGVLALLTGLAITYYVGMNTLILIGIGLFFLLFYTWPLKYIGLGELSVVLVWGPLMVGGTYFVVSGGHWENWVTVVSLVYALGPTTVLLGKHTDKLNQDKAKGVRTLPVLLGETTSRYLTIALWVIQYGMVIYLVAMHVMSPALLVVFISLPKFISATKVFLKPRPATSPSGYDPTAWPLYLVAHAFGFTRQFGLLFLLGLLTDLVLSVVL